MKKTNYIPRFLCLVLAISIIISLGGTPICANDAKVSNNTNDKLSKAIVMYVNSPIALVNGNETQIDSNIKNTPFIRNNRSMVPIAFVAQAFGATVKWNSTLHTVNIMKDKTHVKFTLGSKYMIVNNAKIVIDVPCQSVNDRTYIPISAVSKALGKEIFYDRGLIIISGYKKVFDSTKDRAVLDSLISRLNNLPKIGSVENLKKILETSSINNNYFRRNYMYAMDDSVTSTTTAPPKSESSNKPEAPIPAPEASGNGIADYSTTNVQVQGVDEADIIKTDGNYIYHVNQNKITITKAIPANEMALQSVILFGETTFSPIEIYINKNKLIVIGSTYQAAVPPVRTQTDKPQTSTPQTSTPQVDTSKIVDMPQVKKQQTREAILQNKMAMPPFYIYSGQVAARIYNIEDKSKPNFVREIVIDGDYVSSRMIGSDLYMLSNKGINYYYQNNDFVTPYYRDSAFSKQDVAMELKNIRYIPDCLEPNYLVVAGISTEDANKQANISAYLGAGSNIYASNDNLYVAVPKYMHGRQIQGGKAESMTQTSIFKFSLNQANVTYLSKGNVPGSILNQFSMDEYNGYFRIATTTGELWSSDENISQNNVYVLDETMNQCGKLEGLAPGEKIYSVRYIGDRAYVVTFRTVDPLFVLDMKDPTQPKVDGALKIPGYSDYLHPYDENHIIGFGKDTFEIKGNAYYKGFKMAMFDISDVRNPKQLFTENIGDRGTYSELLNNHKALMFNKAKGILAFPVTLMEIKQKDNSLQPEYEELQYGQFTFQGAYIYSIDLKTGFNLRGRITHLSEDDYLKSGMYGYNNTKNVDRIMYIGDNIYTISNKFIKANDMSTIRELGCVETNTDSKEK